MSKAMNLSKVVTKMIEELDLVSVTRCKDCRKRYGDKCPMRHVEWQEYDDDGYIETDDVVYDNTMEYGFCDRGEADDE